MKNKILTLFLSTLVGSAFGAAIPSTIVGGGSDYLNIDSGSYLFDASTKPTITINSGTGGYAGVEGGALTYTFNHGAENDASVAPTYNFITVNSDFEFKNKINMEFTAKVSWNDLTMAKVTVNNGATLKLHDINTSFSIGNTAQLVLVGNSSTTNRSTVEIGTSSGYGTLALICQQGIHVKLQQAAAMHQYHFYHGAKMTLGGDITMSNNIYVRTPQGSGALASNLVSGTLDLAGHNMKTQGLIFNPASVNNAEFVVDYGDNDISQYCALGTLSPKAGLTNYIRVQNFGLNDFLLFYNEVDTDMLLFDDYGVKGTDYEVVKLAEKVQYLGTSYNAYTIIPEPSTYAMILGALAIGFVAYRRRK